MIAGLFGVVSSQIDVPFSTTTKITSEFETAVGGTNSAINAAIGFGDGVYGAWADSGGGTGPYVTKKYPGDQSTAWGISADNSGTRQRVYYLGGYWFAVSTNNAGIRYTPNINNNAMSAPPTGLGAYTYPRVGFHPGSTPGFIFGNQTGRVGWITQDIPNSTPTNYAIDTPTSLTIRGIASSGSVAVCVGQNTATSSLAPFIYSTTDPTGANWTARTSSFGASGTINEVVYGNGYFVAVGSNSKVAYSTDGTTWTQKTTGITSTNVQSVVYHRGKFFIIGDDFLIYRSNTSDPSGTWSSMGDISANTFGNTDRLISSEAYIVVLDRTATQVLFFR